MKTFVMGDPHGGHRSMIQCFERSGFDYEYDELIVLGDVVDGWPETRECVDELLSIKNLIYIIGNHDMWAYNWSKHDERESIWVCQGGWNTLKSYGFKPMPKEHMAFFENSNLWIEDEERDMIFVHGGFNPKVPIENQKPSDIMWDRDLIAYAKKMETRERCRAYDTKSDFVRPKITKYGEVFVGHTTTLALTKGTDPIHYCNVWDLDTGGGWNGKLTIMNVDTKEFWQSDKVSDLYREHVGRHEFSLHKDEVSKWLSYQS
jgi:serine/threonine protein phosphatase 1